MDIIKKIDNILEEGIYDPGIFKAIFLAGGPGSGKSFVASKTTLGHGLKLVNSDEIFEHLMKVAGKDLKIAGLTAKEAKEKDKIRKSAKDLTFARKRMYVEGRLGLVIDGTGKDFHKIIAQKELLNELGYDTYMIFVNTTLDVALKRNLQRERSVADDLVKKMWTGVQANLGKFQASFTESNFFIVDNTKDEKDKVIFSVVWKKLMKLIRKPISNPIGKEWVSKEKEKRKK